MSESLALMKPILYLAGFAIVIQLFTLSIYAAALRRKKWLDAVLSALNRDAVPPIELTLLETCSSKLEALGFHGAYYQAVRSRSEEEAKYQLWVGDGRQLVYARITRCEKPETWHPCDVSFWSQFSDGHYLVTSDCAALNFLAYPDEDVTLNETDTADFSRQLDLHGKKIEELSLSHGKALPADVEAVAQTEASVRNRQIETLRKRGLLSNTGTSLTLWGVIRLAERFEASANKAHRSLKRKRNGAPLINEVPIEAEICGYKSVYSDLNSTRSSFSRKIWILILSIIVFAAAIQHTGSPLGILVLIGVILFHEMGHVAAMRFFGYRDVGVLFIPFLGAIATGNRDNAPGYQRVIVSLAGPVPGILLAVALAVCFPTAKVPLLSMTIYLLAYLNLLNLLPVQPLDGGRIVNHLVFSRFPLLESFFLLFSAFVLLIAAGSFHSSALSLLAIIIFLGIPASFRKARLLRGFRSRTRGRDLPSGICVLKEVFGFLREKRRFLKLPCLKRYELANFIVRNISIKHPTFLQASGLLAVYVGALLIVPATLLAFAPKPSNSHQPAAAQAVSNDPAASKDPAGRAAVSDQPAGATTNGADDARKTQTKSNDTVGN